MELQYKTKQRWDSLIWKEYRTEKGNRSCSSLNRVGPKSNSNKEKKENENIQYFEIF